MLSDVLRDIVETFVWEGQGTLAFQVRTRLGKKWHQLDEFLPTRELQLIGSKYFPGFQALERPEINERTRGHARRCTGTVLQCLRMHYERNGPTCIRISEVHAWAKTLDDSASVQMVNVGMLFAYDFPRFLGGPGFLAVPVDANDTIFQITIGDNILEFESLEIAWKEEVERRKSEQEEELTPPAELGESTKRSSGLPTAIDVSFVSNSGLRRIIERDWKELQESTGLKSRMILCVSLIEALLLDALKSNEAKARSSTKAAKEPLEQWHLSRLIDVAIDIGTISSGADKLSHGVREFRNLVHPGLELDSRLVVGTHEANIAEEVLKIVIRDLREHKAVPTEKTPIRIKFIGRRKPPAKG